jgi:glycosyltransferase involved in cell wall biosynthesis
VIPNGADLAACPNGDDAGHTVRQRLGLAADAVVLGFVGFVRAWHGVGWALEALPYLSSEAHLVIVGDGPALPA